MAPTASTGAGSRVGFTDASQLLVPSSLVFLGLFAAIIRLTNLWLNGRLASAVGSDLSCKRIGGLFVSLGVHLQRNSSAVITAITTQINLTVAALNSIPADHFFFGGYRVAYRFTVD